MSIVLSAGSGHEHFKLNTPLGGVEIGDGTENAFGSLDVSNYGNSCQVDLYTYTGGPTSGSRLKLFNAGGNSGSPSTLWDEDPCGEVVFGGYNGSSWDEVAKIHTDWRTGGAGELTVQIHNGTSQEDYMQFCGPTGVICLFKTLCLKANEPDNPQIMLYQFSTDNDDWANIALCKSAAGASPTMTDTGSGDWLGSIDFYGCFDGAWAYGAAIASAQVDDPDVGADNVPAFLELCTFKGTGTHQHWAMQIVLRGDTGRVGFGLQDPVSWLHAHNGQDDSACYLRFTNDDTGTTVDDGVVVGVDVDETAVFWNFENTDMYFATNDTARMAVLAGGQLKLLLSTDDLRFDDADADGGSGTQFGSSTAPMDACIEVTIGTTTVYIPGTYTVPGSW